MDFGDILPAQCAVQSFDSQEKEGTEGEGRVMLSFLGVDMIRSRAGLS